MPIVIYVILMLDVCTNTIDTRYTRSPTHFHNPNSDCRVVPYKPRLAKHLWLLTEDVTFATHWTLVRIHLTWMQRFRYNWVEEYMKPLKGKIGD